MRSFKIIPLLFLSLIHFTSTSFALQSAFTFSGSLTGVASPVTSIQLTIYSGACNLYSQNYSNVSLDASGGFSVGIDGSGVFLNGTSTSLAQVLDIKNTNITGQASCVVNGTTASWAISVVVNGTALSGAVPIQAVPFALHALHADKVNGQSFSSTSANNFDILSYNGSSWTPISPTSVRTNLGLGPLATASPSGIANATTYLRGDNSWATLPSGEATTVTNIGTGFDVYKQMSGSNIELRRINAGSAAITVTQNANDLSLDIATVSIAKGGTGATSALAGFNALSPLTSKGDLLVHDASNNIRLPAGTNGQILSADSTQASGLKWVGIPAGDNLGNHTATQNLDLANFKMIGGGGTNGISISATGFVGMGTTTPATQVDVAGTLKVADGGEACSIAANGGMIRYIAGNLQFCNGVSWQTLGVSGAGISGINGLTGPTQTFSTGTAGTDFAISSAGSTHTFNLPTASAVNRGALSSADWTTFNSKLNAITNTAALNTGKIWIGDAANKAQEQSLSQDVTISNFGVATIQKLQNRTLAAAAPSLGTFLKYNNTLSQWEPSAFATCNGASQVQHYNSVTDTWSCDMISVSTATGTLAIANGGTGATSATGAMNAISPLTSKGDLLVRDASNNIRLPAGTNGQLLSADSTQASGLKWIAPPVSTPALSDLLGASAANTIDSQNFAQTWNWSTATTQSALSLNANALTTGSLLKLTTTNNSLNSANGILNVANTGTSTNGVLAKFQANSTAGSGMTVLANGKVGIGTTSPAAQLEMTGTLKIADGGETCSIGPHGGMIRYNAGNLQFCNGASWQTLGVSGSGISSINGLTGPAQTFSTGTTGTDFAISSAGAIHTFNLPTASASNRGALSSTDWLIFNNKLSSISNNASLANGSLWVGDGTNKAQERTPSGDVFMSSAGAFTVTQLQGRTLHNIAPGLGAQLKWNNSLSRWEPFVFPTCIGVNSALHYNAGTDTWTCDNINDNLGNHTATQNLNLGTFQLVGNGGSSGISVDTTGKVGIGTPAPGELLHLKTSNSAMLTTRIENTSASGYAGINFKTNNREYELIAGGSATSLANDFAIYDKTAGENRLVVDESGKIGIGTETPYALLDIHDNSVFDPNLRLLDSSLTGYASLRLESTGRTYDIDVGGASAPNIPNKFAIWDNQANQYRLVIDTSGNVGMGTTDPQARLEVSGDVKIGNTGNACTGANAGSTRYNSGRLELCDSTKWVPYGGNLRKATIKRTIASDSFSTTNHTVIYDTIHQDNSGGSLTSVANRFTIPAGMYKARLCFNDGGIKVSNGEVQMDIRKNGNYVVGLPSFYQSVTNSEVLVFKGCSTILDVVGGDYFEVVGGNTTGSFNLYTSGPEFQWFSIEEVP